MDQDSIPKKDLDWVMDTYGAEPRACELLFQRKKGAQGKNIVTRAAMLELFEALDATMAIEVSRVGKTYTFEDLCLKTVLGHCVQGGPQRFWMSSKELFESSTTTDADVQRQMGKLPQMHLKFAAASQHRARASQYREAQVQRWHAVPGRRRNAKTRRAHDGC